MPVHEETPTNSRWAPHFGHEWEILCSILAGKPLLLSKGHADKRSNWQLDRRQIIQLVLLHRRLQKRLQTGILHSQVTEATFLVKASITIDSLSDISEFEPSSSRRVVTLEESHFLGALGFQKENFVSIGAVFIQYWNISDRRDLLGEDRLPSLTPENRCPFLRSKHSKTAASSLNQFDVAFRTKGPNAALPPRKPRTPTKERCNQNQTSSQAVESVVSSTGRGVKRKILGNGGDGSEEDEAVGDKVEIPRSKSMKESPKWYCPVYLMDPSRSPPCGHKGYNIYDLCTHIQTNYHRDKGHVDDEQRKAAKDFHAPRMSPREKYAETLRQIFGLSDEKISDLGDPEYHGPLPNRQRFLGLPQWLIEELDIQPDCRLRNELQGLHETWMQRQQPGPAPQLKPLQGVSSGAIPSQNRLVHDKTDRHKHTSPSLGISIPRMELSQSPGTLPSSPWHTRPEGGPSPGLFTSNQSCPPQENTVPYSPLPAYDPTYSLTPFDDQDTVLGNLGHHDQMHADVQAGLNVQDPVEDGLPILSYADFMYPEVRDILPRSQRQQREHSDSGYMTQQGNHPSSETRLNHRSGVSNADRESTTDYDSLMDECRIQTHGYGTNVDTPEPPAVHTATISLQQILKQPLLPPPLTVTSSRTVGEPAKLFPIVTEKPSEPRAKATRTRTRSPTEPSVSMEGHTCI